MRIGDKEFEPYIGSGEIEATVKRLAAEIGRDYEGRDLVVCMTLTGAFMFGADLVRYLTTEAEVRFVKYASYEGMGTTGKVRCLLPFGEWVRGRDVLIVEDVVDTGLTIQQMLSDVAEMGAKSVAVCALLFKKESFRCGYKVDYMGKEIGNEFIVGYGMDYNEKGRTLGEILRVRNLDV